MFRERNEGRGDQCLVVGRHGGAEDDSGDVFEAVDPLLALTPLTPHVEQLEVEVLVREVRLHNTCSLHSCTQHVLVVGPVVMIIMIIQSNSDKRNSEGGKKRVFIHSFFYQLPN